MKYDLLEGLRKMAAAQDDMQAFIVANETCDKMIANWKRKHGGNPPTKEDFGKAMSKAITAYAEEQRRIAH